MSAVEQATRLARAAVFAVVCVAMSAGGHMLAGGALVAAQTLFVGMAGAFALALALSRHERGPEVVVTVTVGAQALLHELFARSAPLAVAHADHTHTSSPGVGMSVAHLVVAVVTGWWLYRGENATWLMLRLWAMAPLPKLRRLLVGVVEPVTLPIRVVLVAEAKAYRGPELVRAIPRRGPPALLDVR
ncbi:MFS transporter [Nonomuraea jabiensis]|uniref:MFS transporter n=1 Tax=Nonomuraea jabiensis TaxID=882448 RepID=UPI003D75AE12